MVAHCQRMHPNYGQFSQSHQPLAGALTLVVYYKMTLRKMPKIRVLTKQSSQIGRHIQSISRSEGLNLNCRLLTS